MNKYKYRAINDSGRPVRGLLSATSEADLYNQLQQSGLELIACTLSGSQGKASGPLSNLGAKKIKLRDLIQLFVQLEQLQSVGVPLLDALNDVRDSADNPTMRDIMSEIRRDVTDGTSLSEAMQKHPKVFSNLYTSLINAGEETGDLTSVYKQLVHYITWVDNLQTKISKATTQPKIAGVAVVLMLVVMLGHVVPQISVFIENLGQELPFYTVALVATSKFFQAYWIQIIIAPIIIFFALKIARASSSQAAYALDNMALNMPVLGTLVRKSSVAQYTQTFGALYASGIDVLSSLRSTKQTVSNLALIKGLDLVEEYVQAGSSLSDAFKASEQFPSLVVRMLKVGEGSGNLTPVLAKVSEFYTKDVDEAVEGMVEMIQPALTAVMGRLILWIAVSVFGPIYSSFENIKF